jgi:hypothetical protein
VKSSHLLFESATKRSTRAGSPHSRFVPRICALTVYRGGLGNNLVHRIQPIAPNHPAQPAITPLVPRTSLPHSPCHPPAVFRQKTTPDALRTQWQVSAASHPLTSCLPCCPHPAECTPHLSPEKHAHSSPPPLLSPRAGKKAPSKRKAKEDVAPAETAQEGADGVGRVGSGRQAAQVRLPMHAYALACVHGRTGL